VTSAILHWRPLSDRRCSTRRGGRAAGEARAASSSSVGAGASGSNGSSGSDGGSTGSRIAVPRGVRRTRTALAAATGRVWSTDTTDTMIGVMAAANTVPFCQNMGTMNAAAALATPAIKSVVIERPPPPCLGLSELTPLEASGTSQPDRSIRDPGTMSSEPSAQRIHALWPPS
jgi:hypothetical protein